MPGVLLLAPGPVFIDPNKQTVHNDATVTGNGSVSFSGFGARELVLVVNLKNAPTGTTPTIQYTLQEIDPGDGVTPVGASITGAVLSGVGTQTVTLPITLTGSVRVSWAITGAGASFTGVYATLVTRSTPPQSGVDSSGVERPTLVDTEGRPLVVTSPIGLGRASIIDPANDQTANYTNSTPSTLATLSNTTPSYSTLGGLWAFDSVAGSSTDYALFGYQVPSTSTLYIQSVVVGAVLAGNTNSRKPTILQWALATNSSGPSLATPSPNPPIFRPIGLHQTSQSARVGDTFSPGPIVFRPDTPLSVSSLLYFHVVLRIPTSNLNPGQQISGFVMVDGYFE